MSGWSSFHRKRRLSKMPFKVETFENGDFYIFLRTDENGDFRKFCWTQFSNEKTTIEVSDFDWPDMV